MSAPVRIKMSRRHPWRAQHPDAVIVDRSTKWGNPYGIEVTRDHRLAPAVHTVIRDELTYGSYDTAGVAADRAVALFRRYLRVGLTVTVEDVRRELAGRDLACWCPLDQPCHADVLLSLAAAAAP